MDKQQRISLPTDRHHFAYDAQLEELRVTMPGLPGSLQFYSREECYRLRDLLNAVLPVLTTETRTPQTFH